MGTGSIHVGVLPMEYRNPVQSKLIIPLPPRSRRWVKISISFLVIVLVLACLILLTRPRNPHPVSQISYFTVVLDCGSTGTRVNVYEWLRNSTNQQDQPLLLNSFPDHSTNNPLHKDACLYHCMQTEPGLDKFVQNVSGVRAAVEPLLLWAAQQIPPERHRDSSVFLLGTAGLRRLPSNDAAWILETVGTILKEHPFVRRKRWIRVLSGQEEAYYGWTALNFKIGTLEGSSKLPTFGVLDMGGSSLQVVMESDEPSENENVVHLKVGAIEHPILAYSLPAFGLNEAFDRTVAMLGDGQSLSEIADGTLQLRHPCLSAGFLRKYTCHGCIQPNVSNSQNIRSPIWSNQSTSFNLIGDPNWEQCKVLAKAAAIHSSNLDGLGSATDMNCKTRPFSSESTNSSNLRSGLRQGVRFHALSGFFAVYSLLDLNPRANLTRIMERGQQICSGSWLDSKTFFGNRKYAEEFCFRVPYLASLIEDFLCIGNAEIFIGPGDISWTLGAALVEGQHASVSKMEVQPFNFDLMNMKVPVLVARISAKRLRCQSRQSSNFALPSR